MSFFIGRHTKITITPDYREDPHTVDGESCALPVYQLYPTSIEQVTRRDVKDITQFNAISKSYGVQHESTTTRIRGLVDSGYGWGNVDWYSVSVSLIFLESAGGTLKKRTCTGRIISLGVVLGVDQLAQIDLIVLTTGNLIATF